MKLLLMTHDLSCTVTSLITAAHRYPQGVPFQKPARDRDLTVAAVAFAVQLAIDHADADPEQMRQLEGKLIAKLEEWLGDETKSVT